MAWQAIWTEPARKTLRKLDHTMQKRILSYVRDRVLMASHPNQLGQALTGNLGTLWRYRIGDYRLICRIEEERLEIMMLRVGHRKEVYEQ